MQKKAQDFIQKWGGITASELSTAQSFVMELCDLLGVEKSHPTAEQNYIVRADAILTASANRILTRG